MDTPIESGLEVFEPELPAANNLEKEFTPLNQYTQASAGHETSWLKRNLRILLLILVAVVLVAAIIGGAVGGTLRNRHKPTPSPGPSPVTNGPNGPSGTVSLRSLPTPTSQQVSACRDGICPLTISSITWPDIQFIFGFSANRSLVYKAGSSNQWNSTWSDLGGNFTYAPVVVSWGPGRLDAVGVQDDQALYWKAYSNNTWDPNWTNIGGTWATAVDAVSRAPGYINVYGLVSDGGNLQQSAWTPSGNGSTIWVGITNLGGLFPAAPSVAAWSDSREDIFVRGNDNALWHLYWQGSVGWSNWESLGGYLVSNPLVVSSQENWLDVFALGERNSFCWIGYRAEWLDWNCISGNLTFESIPSAVVLGSQRVGAVGLASDDHVYHKSLADSSWSTNWDDLGGPLNGAPVAASFAPNMGNVLGIGMDNALYVGNWNSSVSSWQGSNVWSSLGGNFIPLP